MNNSAWRAPGVILYDHQDQTSDQIFQLPLIVVSEKQKNSKMCENFAFGLTVQLPATPHSQSVYFYQYYHVIAPMAGAVPWLPVGSCVDSDAYLSHIKITFRSMRGYRWLMCDQLVPLGFAPEWLVYIELEWSIEWPGMRDEKGNWPGRAQTSIPLRICPQINCSAIFVRKTLLLSKLFFKWTAWDTIEPPNIISLC